MKQSPYAVARPHNGRTDGRYIYVGLVPENREKHLPLLVAQLKHGNPLAKIDPKKLTVDPRSVGGLRDPDWSTYRDEKRGTVPSKKRGGLGSPAFETQRVGRGVSFAKKGIRYRNKAGRMTWGIPPNAGAYHRWTDGISTENRAGPKPGSPAAKKLGKGSYFFNEKRGWYGIRK